MSQAPCRDRHPPFWNAVLKLGLLAALLALLLVAAIAVSESPSASADPSLDSEELTFLTLINNYRAENGKLPLVIDTRLNAAADWFANDMANDNYWPQSHYDNENPPRSPAQRAAAFGFNAPVGENIAGGFATAQSVFTAWKGSTGHNANMLGNYAVIGIGRAYSSSSQYGWYWVTDFSPFNPPPAGTQTPAPTAPPPTASPTKAPTPTPSSPPTATPTPASHGRFWGDMDCDSHIGPVDSIRVLRLDAGLESATPAGCPNMGETVFVGGVQHIWGDVNCSGEADPTDATALLRFDAGLDVTMGPSCPDLAQPL
ncbi:MAG: CAP domain-containing protein [Dehalococcoidia bacterium]